MIATGLIFLLGVLVATLLALLFVPVLWRNAQKLARRDYAATMPATMSEIRAEVDRVRAEAAMTVRRNEMDARRAREQFALERAAMGRLTTAHAETSASAGQLREEGNALRAELASLNEKHRALEEDYARLELENQDLRETLGEAAAEMRMLEDEALVAASARAIAVDGSSPSEVSASTADDRDDGEARRIAAATSALLALAREQRRGRPGERTGAPGEGPRDAASAVIHPTVMHATPSDGATTSLTLGSGERQLVDELNALAAAPRPADPAERERQNERVRERLAEMAASIIQRAMPNAEPGSPLATIVQARGNVGDEPNGSAPLDLAERVRRLGRSRGDFTVDTSSAIAMDEPEADISSAGSPLPQDATPPSGAKRRRGGARSRQRSPR